MSERSERVRQDATQSIHRIEEDLDQPPEAGLVAKIEERLLAEWIIDLIEAGAVVL